MVVSIPHIPTIRIPIRYAMGDTYQGLYPKWQCNPSIVGVSQVSRFNLVSYDTVTFTFLEPGWVLYDPWKNPKFTHFPMPVLETGSGLWTYQILQVNRFAMPYIYEAMDRAKEHIDETLKIKLHDTIIRGK